MITPNGGVFGRNPKFNTVTTQGGITVGTTATVAGDVTLTNGNIVVASGKGIDFSATAGTGTSELFADYEEGTWTPTYITTSGTPITVTYTTQQGYYTKIGNMVTIQCSVSTASIDVTGATGSIRISGIPFAHGPSLYPGAVGGDNLLWSAAPTRSTVQNQLLTLFLQNGTVVLPADVSTTAGTNRNRVQVTASYFV